MRTYKPEFIRLQNIFEFLPSITYYKNKGGYFNKGSITISWLKWALIIDMNWVADYFNTKKK